MHSIRPWITAAFAFAAILPALGAIGPKRAGGFDIRTDSSAKSRAGVEGYRARATRNAGALAASMASARARLNAAVPHLQVEMNPITKTPEIVGLGTAPGALTGPSGEKPERTVRGFVASNAALFGLDAAQAGQLRTIADYANPAGNLSWVELEQVINGIPVFQGRIRAAVRKDGAVARTTGNLAAGLDYALLAASPQLSAAEAVAAAARTIGVEIDPTGLPAARVENEAKTHVFPAGAFEGETKVDLVYFALEPGVATLAYAMVLWEAVDAYYVLVDAMNGELLWRKNITNDQTQAATYAVYSSDSPAPLSPSNATPGSGIQGTAVPRTTFTIVSELPAFDSLGWIPDGQNTTSGNNVDAGLDLTSPNGIDSNGRATGSPNRVFNFDYTPAGQTGEQSPTLASYRSGVVTNLFFWSNRYHDQLYQFGFTEAAGNFQQNNFSRGGSAADRILAEAQDGSGTNNANFATPPDGQSGRMQMFLFDQPNPDRDGDLDQEIVIHELTHGLSNRLHGNGGGLNSLQAGGMGEGWSDFYARALLSTADEDLAGVYASGGYSTFRFFNIGTDNYYYGIRRFPYALRSNVGANGRPHNPLTFADLDYSQAATGDGAFARSPLIGDDALEVHNSGEVWCMMLLEVRARIIQRLGFAAGNARALQIVTDAMKLDLATPNFIQARDSIIAADNAGFQGEDVADIWAGFAARGMGFGASVTGGNNLRVVESYIAPNLLLGAVTFSDAVTGNNSGFADPGETIVLTIPLINQLTIPAVGVKATLPGGGMADYGDIAPNQTVSREISFTVPATDPAGTRLEIPVTLESSLGPVRPEPQKATVNVGEPVAGFREDFDALPGAALPAGWTTTQTGAGAQWTVVTTGSDSGTRNAFVPSVPNVGTSGLVTPNIPVTSEFARLTFRNAYNFETSQGINWDGMFLQISIGNGPFEEILSAGGRFLSGAYNAPIQALGGSSGWGGLSGGGTGAPAYITTTVLLPAAANGRDVRFRWVAASDPSDIAAGNAGAHIDGVVVENETTFEVINFAPVVTTSPGSAGYTENGPAVVIDPGLTIVDSDSATLVGATVTVTENVDAGDDILAFVDQGGITGSYDSGTAVLTLTGTAAIATYEAALRTVTYASASDNPTALPRTITFIANDGAAGNNLGSAARPIALTTVNDAPTLAPIPDPVPISNNAGPQTLNLTGISAGGGESQALTIVATSGNPGLIPDPTITYTSPESEALLSMTPVAGQSGMAVITVTVTDNGGVANGGLDTFARTFTVTVTAAPNTPPSVNASAGVASYIENQAAISIDPGITVNDADSISLAGATVAINGGFASDQDILAFTPQPGISGSYDAVNGVLTLTGSSGVATYQAALRSVTYFNASDNPSTAARTINFTVNDGAAADNAGSATRELTIMAVNDAPTLAPIADPAVIPPDSSLQTVPLSGITAGGSESQTLTVTATSSNPALIPDPAVTYTSPDSTGSVSYTPVAGQSGESVITVTVTDSGDTANGGANSFSRTFRVVVRLGNSPPSFTAGPNIIVPRSSGLFSQPNWATNISPGPPDEAGQIVDFLVEVTNPSLFLVKPAISSNGTLSFTPAENATGTSLVTVRAHDNGGTAENGSDTSPPQTFTISVATVEEELGVYNGLIQAAPGGPREHARYGAVRVVISRKGSLSVRLVLGGQKFSAKGTVNPIGGVTFGKHGATTALLKRKGLPPLALSLAVDVAGGTDRLSGLLTLGGVPFAELVADRALYTSKKNPKPPLVNPPANLPGKYTVIVTVQTSGNSGVPGTQTPRGHGIGVVSVSGRGSAKLKGTLPDGSKISSSASLSKANVFPLHALTDKKRGSITGFVTFREVPDLSDLDGVDLVWFKPPNSRSKVYPQGWPQGIEVDLEGAAYNTRGGLPPIPGLPPPDADGNAIVNLTNAGLVSALAKAVNVDPKGKITVLAPGTERLELKIKAKSGSVQGRFVHPVTGAKLKIRAIIIQKQQTAGGFFIHGPESGGFTLAPPPPPPPPP